MMLRAPLMMLLESSVVGVRKAGTWISVETVLNVGLGLTLLHFLDAQGVVLSTLIAIVLVTSIGIAPAALRMADLTLKDLLTKSLAPVLLPLGIALPIWLAISWLVGGHGLAAVLAAVAASCAAFFVPFWLTLPSNERADLRPGRRRRRPRAAAADPTQNVG